MTSGNPRAELENHSSHGSHRFDGHQARNGNRHISTLWGLEQAQRVFPVEPATATGYPTPEAQGTPAAEDLEAHQSLTAADPKPATQKESPISSRDEINASTMAIVSMRKPKAGSKSTLSATKGKASPQKVEKPVSKANRTRKTVMKWQKLVEELMANPLPDYSQTDLLFTTREDAVEDARERTKQSPTYWMPPAPDSSTPQTLQERQAVVRKLLGALKDTSRAKDTDSKSFETRWTTAGKRQYTDAALEATCWEILVRISHLK